MLELFTLEVTLTCMGMTHSSSVHGPLPLAFMTCLLRWARSTIAGTSGWPLSSTITETVEHLQLLAII
ncbi:hypothetical protein D3C80_1920010 [compost metagenome]